MAYLVLGLILQPVSGGSLDSSQTKIQDGFFHPPPDGWDFGGDANGTAQHGIDKDLYIQLWSGDKDNYVLINQTRKKKKNGKNPPLEGDMGIQWLNATDATFLRPPKAVETWNEGEVKDLPLTGVDESKYTKNSDLHSKKYIKDAHITIFSIHPSTRLHYNATTSNKPGKIRKNDWEPFLVRPNGTLTAYIDYRIKLPDDKIKNLNPSNPYPPVGDRVKVKKKIIYKIDNKSVANTTVHNQTMELGNTTTPNRRPIVDYENASNDTSFLRARSRVNVTVNKTVKYKYKEGVCKNDPSNNKSTPCPINERKGYKYYWGPIENYTLINESVEVSDNRDVTIHPDINGSVWMLPYLDYPTQNDHTAVYFRNDLGLWSRLDAAIQGGKPRIMVDNTWRFYSEQAKGWNKLTSSFNSGGKLTLHSDNHPLQIHAFPSRYDTRVRSNVIGNHQHIPVGRSMFIINPLEITPKLPDRINVSLEDITYNPSENILFEYYGEYEGDYVVHGLVRGYTEKIKRNKTNRPPYTKWVYNGTDIKVNGNYLHSPSPTNLSLSFLGYTSNGMKIKVKLRDTRHNDPIPITTKNHPLGYDIYVEGKEVTTNWQGVGTVTVPNQTVVEGRFEPQSWWDYFATFEPDDKSRPPKLYRDEAVLGNKRGFDLSDPFGWLRLFFWLLLIASPLLLVLYMTKTLFAPLEENQKRRTQ